MTKYQQEHLLYVEMSNCIYKGASKIYIYILQEINRSSLYGLLYLQKKKKSSCDTSFREFPLS